MSDWAAKIAAMAAKAAGTPEAVARIEATLRTELGGQRLRIEPRPPVTLDRINAGLYAGHTVVQIAAELQCSRATIYRHITPGRYGRNKRNKAVQEVRRQQSR